MKYLLGLDIGTSGTKTVLVDEKGKMIASSTVEYPLYQLQNGWAEQDPADWWNAACESCQNVLKKTKTDPAQIAAVGLTGQMHSLVMLDEGCNILRHAILWCDQRTSLEC